MHILLTRRQTNEVKSNPQTYRFLPKNVNFDYLKPGSKAVYAMDFRAVRFPLDSGDYECVITNLPEEGFPPVKIREIYAMRWGIGTSFRELKYAVGLNNFHSKKTESITQEIFARLTLYNYCEAITMQVIVRQPSGIITVLNNP